MAETFDPKSHIKTLASLDLNPSSSNLTSENINTGNLVYSERSFVSAIQGTRPPSPVPYLTIQTDTLLPTNDSSFNYNTLIIEGTVMAHALTGLDNTDFPENIRFTKTYVKSWEGVDLPKESSLFISYPVQFSPPTNQNITNPTSNVLSDYSSDKNYVKFDYISDTYTAYLHVNERTRAIVKGTYIFM